MNVFELVAKLTLDSSEYDRAIMAAKGSTAKGGQGIVAAIEGAKKKMGIAAMAMGGAMIAFGASSVKTGMQFDSAMSQVAATMGKTMSEMESETGKVDLAWGEFSGNLREYAQEMGAHTKFSATEAAEALNYMALAGYKTQESMDMLPNVLNLAAAGNMDLATASDMVTDASSALGLDMKQTTAMVDQMAAASANSNTSVEQLGSAMLTVGGTAKVLRGGTTELSTALGILADNGTKGAEGGTALRNILTSIQGSKFEKTFGEMGISAYDAQGKLRSLKDIFGDMQVAMDGMTDEQRTDIINKTFNARDLKNVNALLGTTTDRWDELSAAIDNSEGAAQKMADTQLDNLAGDITLLKSAFEGLQISVSDKLTPTFRKFVQFLTWCIDHANTLGPIILGLGSAFITFAIAVNRATIVSKVSTGFKALFGILAGNPIGLAIAAFVGLAVALVTLYKNNEDFRNKVNAIWDSVKEKVSTVVTTISNLWNGAKNMVTTVATTIRDKVVSAWNTIKSATLTAWNLVKTYIINPVKTVLSVVVAVFKLLLAGILVVFVAIANKAMEYWAIIKAYIIEPVKQIYQQVQAKFNELKNRAIQIWNTIKAYALSIWNGIKTNIINPIKGAYDNAVSRFNALRSKVAEIWNTIKANALSAWNTVKTNIATPIQNAYNTVVSKIESLRASISAKWDSIKSTASSAWNTVKSHITGPIQSAYSTISSKLSSMASTISGKWSSIKSAASSAWNTVKSNITGPIQTAYDKVTGIISKIKDKFPIKLGKLLNFKLPEITIGTKEKEVGGKKIKVPDFDLSWKRKAMDQPFLYTGATIFGAGEAGDEMLYGHASLMQDIKEAMASVSGNQQFDTETMATIVGEIVGERVAEALEDVNIILDRRSMGKFARQSVGATI